MKRFIKHFLIAILLTLVLVCLHTFFYQLYNDIENWPGFIKSSVINNAIYAIPFYLMNGIAHDYARSKEKSYKMSNIQYWTIYLFVIVVLNTLLAFIVNILHNIINQGTIGLSGLNLKFFLSSLIISFIIGGFFYSYYYLKARFDKKSVKQETKIQQVTQYHEALKSQIGPHFLFNSLNVLSGLVDENPERAQSFIADLAQVYRYVLDQKDKNWVTVAEEIDFAQNYLELVKTRFESGLNVDIQQDLIESHLMLPPLTLQLLLENCIKHNAITKEKPLVIKIFTEDKKLIVQNNLNPKKVFSERRGVGLKQIKQRYTFLNKTIEIEQDENLFVVKVPLLNEEELD